jgi:hypothetical protein
LTSEHAQVSASSDAAMRLKSLSRVGSASAAKPLDKSTASRVLRNASVTGEQQVGAVRVILILINIA